MRTVLAIAVISGIVTLIPQDRVEAEADIFQTAINYVFTGSTDPQDAPEIVDRKSCIIVMRDPQFKRYIRYYLSRFRMDTATFSKTYAGSQTVYDLEVESDRVLLEYLDMDKTTVAQGYKSAHIPLPGNIDQTQKALKIIFANDCKPDQPKAPF